MDPETAPDNAKDEPDGLTGADESAATPAIRIFTDCRVWAIDSRALTALCQLDGQLVKSAETQAARGGRAPARTGGVATVPLKGVLMPGGMDFLSWLFDIPSGLEAFRAQFSEAIDDPEVEAVVIDVDSPGGPVDLIPETAAQVRAGRERKPVVAACNTMAASAAYWIASQADEVVVTPSGQAGSIGVWSAHLDRSGQYELMGIKPTLISAGKYKVEGNAYEPLGDEARKHWQAEVDEYYRMFTGDVAAGRGVTRDEVVDGYGEGQCLPARQAKSAGLVDRVETLADTVARISSPAGRRALDRRRADADPSLSDPPISYTPDERNRLLAVLA